MGLMYLLCQNIGKQKKNCKYDTLIKLFFKTIYRVYIDSLEKSYEIKLARDFQNIEIRETDKDSSTFNEPKRGLYINFLDNDLKYIKLFTWGYPFGLYWNLRRILKKISFRKRKTY